MRLVKDRAEITGRVALCLVFLIFSAILFAYMLLLAGSSLAQSVEDTTGGETTDDTGKETTNEGATGDETAPPPSSGADSDCPGAKQVATTGPNETENQRIPFDIRGRTFRVSYSVDFSNPRDFNILEVDIEDRFGLVEFESIDKDQTGSFIVTEGRGAYDLVTNVRPDDGAIYQVTVEDCIGEDQKSIPKRGKGEGTIMGIPKKPLPPTGGIPLVLLVGFALICGGAAILRDRR